MEGFTKQRPFDFQQVEHILEYFLSSFSNQAG